MKELEDPKYHSQLGHNIIHSLLHPNLYDQKFLQMSLDHDSLKLEPKEKRLTKIVSVFDVVLEDHHKYHCRFCKGLHSFYKSRSQHGYRSH